MSYILNKLLEWFIEILGGMIYSNYVTMCQTIVSMTTLLTDDLTQTPNTWNLGIFNVISTICTNFILPLAILVLTFVMVYELYETFILNNNNQTDIGAGTFIKWYLKMFVCLLLLNHAFEIVVAIFALSANITTDVLNYINGSAASSVSGSLVDFVGTDNFKSEFIAIFVDLGVDGIGATLLLFILSIINGLMGMIFVPLVSLVVVIRYFNSYLYMSFAPFAFATFGNDKIGQIGHNYLKNILALAFQVLLITLVIAVYYGSMQGLMYAVFNNQNNLTYDALENAMVQNLLISFVMIIVLFKTDNIARSIFTAQG